MQNLNRKFNGFTKDTNRDSSNRPERNPQQGKNNPWGIGKGTVKSKLAWNFAVDYNDHFETPAVAYQDLKPALIVLAKHLGKSPADLVIYDPYWCQGSMVELLKDQGFPNVINRNRDFYADIAKKVIPGTATECVTRY
jgi:hypothetical protein